MKNIFYAVVLCLFAPGVKAEQNNYYAPPTQPMGQGFKPFTDMFSQPASPTPPPAPSASGPTRPRAGEPDYTEQERNEWIAACNSARDKSSAEFKKCFEEKKSRSLSEINKRQTDIESRQAVPEKNQVPKVEEMDEKDPAFKDVTIEKDGE